MFPWSGGTGGPTSEETIKLFRAFQPYRLEKYRFHDALTGAVRTSSGDLDGAPCDSAEGALVVISNTSPESAKNVAWTVNPGALNLDPTQLRVEDKSTGRVQPIAPSGLSDRSLVTALDGYEYRLFEVRPVR